MVATLERKGARVPFEHLVHLYESEEGLARYVVPFLAAGLPEQAVAVVATPEHRALLADGLARCGFDVPRLRREGRYVDRDAEELLGTFFTGGRVDVAAFRASVGALVRAQAQAFGRVHVYGEMVACLWGRGDARSAVELEQAWNALAGMADFRLCCAYPLSAMSLGGTPHVDGVLAAHTAAE
jgi:hypothetical protein